MSAGVLGWGVWRAVDPSSSAKLATSHVGRMGVHPFENFQLWKADEAVKELGSYFCQEVVFGTKVPIGCIKSEKPRLPDLLEN